ncbi:MAG: DUF2189 domain-containing protein [Paracoccaceae bacterium]
MTDQTRHIPREHGAPQLRAPNAAILRQSLGYGWRDFRSAPLYGLLAGLACCVAGWALLAITMAAGHTFWLILAVFGFPLIAPFAALGTYVVSRALEDGVRPSVDEVLRMLWAERTRQLPWLCMMMIVALLFWFFLGHMIFALFLGLAPMTNVSTSFSVFLTPNGLMMLGLGSVVGGLFALLLYSICVIGLPMLLDREVDYVTAMLSSIGCVTDNPLLMIGWAATIALFVLLAMLPGFLGLIVVLPWLGHASWHLYRALTDTA